MWIERLIAAVTTIPMISTDCGWNPTTTAQNQIYPGCIPNMHKVSLKDKAFYWAFAAHFVEARLSCRGSICSQNAQAVKMHRHNMMQLLMFDKLSPVGN